ncbi:J domain-containing protein [Salmonella enterica]|nr:J domain-containing protein [Salmonella enterica]
MNICWEILGIEPTTDLECIRQAYLALLPSFHPESDPQGFKRLRQAYEEAQHWAASPAEDAKTEEVGDEHEILVAFRELLASERDRFQPSAWQKFIQQLNQCSMDEIDKLRWQLCDIAMKTETISLSCLALLAQRLNWQPQEADDDAEGEELEAFSRLSTQGEPETPLLDLYRTAEQVVLEAFPKEKPFFRLLIRLEEGQSCPLEALITQALSSKIAMKPGDIRDKKELAEELRLAAEKEEKKLSSEAKTEAPRQAESGGVMKIMKIVGLIALIVCALNRFFHFF